MKKEVEKLKFSQKKSKNLKIYVHSLEEILNHFRQEWCSMFIKFGIVYYEVQGKVGICVTHILNYDWI